MDVPRHREPSLQDLLCIVQGRLQEVLKVFLLGHVLVACFPPLGYGLTKINDNLEESVHERNSVSKNAAAVQEHRLWGPVEGVGIQDGLDHDEGLGEILPGTVVPIIQ